MRGDILERMPARRPQSNEADQPSLERFAFREAITMKKTKTVHATADSLAKSDDRFFGQV